MRKFCSEVTEFALFRFLLLRSFLSQQFLCFHEDTEICHRTFVVWNCNEKQTQLLVHTELKLDLCSLLTISLPILCIAISQDLHCYTFHSGGSRGGVRGAPPPLFLVQTEARRDEKKILRPGHLLTQGLYDRASPYLKIWICQFQALSTGIPIFLKTDIFSSVFPKNTHPRIVVARYRHLGGRG